MKTNLKQLDNEVIKVITGFGFNELTYWVKRVGMENESCGTRTKGENQRGRQSSNDDDLIICFTSSK